MIFSIAFVLDAPPPIHPTMLLLVSACDDPFAVIKSPKSIAFPVVAMVTKSITFVVLGVPSPPVKTPRVLSEVPDAL